MTFQGLIWDGLRWYLETTARRNSAETTARRTEKQLFHAAGHSHTSAQTGEFGIFRDELHMSAWSAWATLFSGPILSSFVYRFHLQVTHVPGFSGWHLEKQTETVPRIKHGNGETGVGRGEWQSSARGAWGSGGGGKEVGVLHFSSSQSPACKFRNKQEM